MARPALNWIVPYPPGGSTDTFARPIAEYSNPPIGQTVVIDNRAAPAERSVPPSRPCQA